MTEEQESLIHETICNMPYCLLNVLNKEVSPEEAVAIYLWLDHHKRWLIPVSMVRCLPTAQKKAA